MGLWDCLADGSAMTSSQVPHSVAMVLRGMSAGAAAASDVVLQAHGGLRVVAADDEFLQGGIPGNCKQGSGFQWLLGES